MAQTKNVNMTPNDTLPRLRLSQYDVGRELAFKLCDGALSYTVPTGATVKLMGTKPSGFGFTESCTVSGNTASISTTAGMTDEWGAVVCELVVEKSGVRLGSTNLLLVVEKSPHPEGTTDGSQETVIPTLTLLVERVEAAASSILDMTVEAETLAAGSDATYSYDEETNTATFGIPRGADGSLASGVLAPTYSTSGTYAVGDYVYYSGNLYRCTTAITTAESWTSGHWTQVALAPEVSDLKSDINEITGNAILSFDNKKKYIALNGETADVNTFGSSDNFECAVIPCSKGDVFILTAKGGTNTRAWGFVASDGTVLSVAPSSTIVVEEVLVAPADSAYFVSNNNFAYPYKGQIIKGTGVGLVKTKLIRLKDNVNDLSAYFEKVPETINLYDADNDSVVQADPDYTVGTVYLNGYSGDLVVSTAGNRAAYIGSLHVYDEYDNDMVVSYGATVSYASPAREGKVVTIPQGAKYFTFRYRTHHSTLGTLVSDVMVTKGNTLSVGAFVEYDGHHKLTDIVGAELSITPVYVSTIGSDNNDGSSPSTAFATFAKALSVSSVVYAERGTYTESIRISNKRNVKILPYDNDDHTQASKEDRKKITIKGATHIDKGDMTLSEGLYIATAEGANFVRVFTTHIYNPVVSGKLYNCNIFVVYSDYSKNTKLKPVLTLTEAQNESDTFYWDGTDIYCNIADPDFNAVEVVTQLSDLVKIENCETVHLEDVEFAYAQQNIAIFNYCSNVELNNVDFIGSGVAHGVTFDNSNVVLNNCFATQNGYDGFNFHYFGVSEMNNCKALYNYDDGCSHHESCEGTINGGVFKGNGKGGISPAYGAIVNVYNALVLDNLTYGIGYLSTNSGHRATTGIVGSCAMANNPYGLYIQSGCVVDAIGCRYSGNIEDKQSAGTLNEY